MYKICFPEPKPLVTMMNFLTNDKRSPDKNRMPVNQPGQGVSIWRYVVWMLVVMAFAIYLFNEGQQSQITTLSYSAFKDKISNGEITKVILQGDQITGVAEKQQKQQTQKSGSSVNKKTAESGAGKVFQTTLPPIDDPQFMPLLEKKGVEIQAKSEHTPWWMGILVSFLPWLIILGLVYYGMRRMQERYGQGGAGGGIFGFGKSKAKRFRKGESKVTFDDVAGLENAKQDLREITAYLRDPQRYGKLGAKIPKGILLMGPPGIGKTLLAKAVAGEAEATFYSISGSEFIEMFVGVGASRVRDMFESAKKDAPSIIFIDEIDSVGRARGTGLGGGHDEREQTLNQILSEMDGFAPHEAVVVLAATNRPDVLDPALMRPGRFDRKVTLDLPDRKARQAILTIHAKDVPLSDDVDLERLAAITVGFAGADLENLVNEAALLAGRDKKENVDMHAFLAARDKVVLGAKREMVMGEEEKQMVAYHEAGHTVIASLLPTADPLDKVTIIPRGRALGATEQIPEEDRHNLRKSYLCDRIGIMLGGRAAENLVFGEVSTGAESDLKQATHIARRMVAQWGMSDKLGPVAFRRGEDHIFLGREMAQQKDFSEQTAWMIDEEVRQIVLDQEKRVLEILRENRAKLEALAENLLDRETLEPGEIHEILATA
jgi:cell division protease FtsH